MQSVDRENKIGCPSPEISAYIDGELSPGDELNLEQHLSACRTCTDDLNLQKSFLNALDYSLEEEATIELPNNFTKSVVANAESRVSGLRRPRERRNAALICVALGLFAVIAFGSNLETTLAATAAVFEKIFAVVSSIGHLAYNISLGAAIIFRTLGSKLLFDSTAMVVLCLALFAASMYLFSRLLVRLHRT